MSASSATVSSSGGISGQERFRVKVSKLISSRYAGNVRPESWDLRTAGTDTIETEDGRTLKLLSDGQQSPPRPGWQLVITGGDGAEGYTWTLYSMPHAE